MEDVLDLLKNPMLAGDGELIDNLKRGYGHVDPSAGGRLPFRQAEFIKGRK